MATYNKFNRFVQDLAQKVHNLNTSQDALMVMLSNTAPAATANTFTDVTQIPVGNGYSNGGGAATISSSGQTSGTFKLVCANVIFTASGGPVGPLRYAVLYNDTPASGQINPLIAWWDYGSPVTLNDTETFTVAFDQSNGVFQLV